MKCRSKGHFKNEELVLTVEVDVSYGMNKDVFVFLAGFNWEIFDRLRKRKIRIKITFFSK